MTDVSETITYVLEAYEERADYIEYTGNPKHPHLAGSKVKLSREDFNILGQPPKIMVRLEADEVQAEPVPKAKSKKK